MDNISGKNRSNKNLLYLGLFILPIGVALTSLITAWTRPIVGGLIPKSDITINSVAQVLTLLLLIATFLERALEIYAITFRDAEKKRKESNGESTSEYENETAQITSLSALAAGIIISTIGIRGIEPFINITSETNWQTSCLRISDILLTGAVLAGGSDFVHKILQTFTTFLETTATFNKSTEASNKANIAVERSREVEHQLKEAETRKAINEIQTEGTVTP